MLLWLKYSILSMINKSLCLSISIIYISNIIHEITFIWSKELKWT